MKLLVDTSIWVDHFQGKDTQLDEPPSRASPRLLHPFVFGELLLAGLPKDRSLRQNLQALSEAPVAATFEVAQLIEAATLSGTGIGYVDAHLLASAQLLDDGRIVTRDNALAQQAKRFGVLFDA